MPLDEEDAQRLQRHAIEALGEVKDWAWAHHELPVGAIMVSAEQATLYAARLEWHARLEAALSAIGEVDTV
ncbi:MAG TPA: hypothetical protein VJU61_10815 [Polyangiaceae bacterium]|nr:hypothetical protein [Polyangiaceae bacterium]